MSRFFTNNIFVHVICIVSSVVIAIKLLDWIIEHNYDVYPLASSSSSTSTLASSIWCSGEVHTNRRCRLENICYKRDTRDYIFFYDSKLSIQSGIPADRFKPALADLSSVANHNRYYFNYVQIPVEAYHQLSKTHRITNFKGKTIIFGRFKPDNVMHLLHDDVLPLMATLLDLDIKQSHNLFMDDQWLPVNATVHAYGGELYSKLFNLDQVLSAEEVPPSSIVCFEEAYVGLSKTTVWYQYGFRTPQGPVPKSKYDVDIVRKLVDTAYAKLLPQPVACEQHYVLLLTRQKTRLILNEHDVVAVLSTIAKLPVLRIRMEGFRSVVELIKKFRCAKMLAGMHGSAFIFGMFMPHATSVIELFPFAINPEHYTPYKTMAKLIGLQYYAWRNMDSRNTVPHPENPPELGGIEHLPSARRDEIRRNNNDVEPHLCCNDPWWLYRIYQDTFVDSHFFQQVVDDALAGFLNYEYQDAMKLSPGPVLNLRCKRVNSNGGQTTTNVTWLPPWNVQYFDDLPDLKYEILLHFSNDSANMYTSEEQFALVDMNPDDSVSIWVRGVVDQDKGPFVKEPTSC